MYLRKDPIALARLAAIDFTLHFSAGDRPKLPERLSRILICNPAHMGDVLITTSLIRKMREYSPELSIDFIGGSWARPIFERCPGIRNSYVLDHWMLNRSEITKAEKKRIFKSQASNLSCAIDNSDYDAIFVVYAYEPSLIPILSRSGKKIPIVGFTSAGHGPILSYKKGSGHRQDVHEINHQASLFDKWMDLPCDPSVYVPWIEDLEESELVRQHIVIHPGCGNSVKEWPVDNWIKLVGELKKNGFRVAITGHGVREAAVADMVAGATGAENWVGHLKWAEYCSVIKSAMLVVGVDSMACHLASAYKTNSVVIAAPISNMARWRPLGKHTYVCEVQGANDSRRFASPDQVLNVVLNKVSLAT